MKNNKIALCFGALAIFFILMTASVAASASTYGTVVFDYNGLESYGTVKRHTPESTKSLSGGMFDLTQLDTGSFTPSLMGNDPSNIAKFSAFCLEPNVGISSGSTYELKDLESASMYSFASSTDGIGATKASHIRQLLAGVYPVFGVAISNTKALAIQIALWEIVREESDKYNVYRDYTDTDDVVWFSSYWDYKNHSEAADAMSYAQTYLDTYVGKGGPELTNLYALVMDGGQDLLVQVNAVPIPGAVWLFGSAIAGLIGFGKRRKS